MKYFLAYFHCPENLHKVDQRTLFQISSIPPSEDPNTGMHKIHVLCSDVEMVNISFEYFPVQEGSRCINKENRGYAFGDVVSHNGNAELSTKILKSNPNDFALIKKPRSNFPTELVPLRWHFIRDIGKYRFGYYNRSDEFKVVQSTKYLKAVSGKAFISV